MSQKYYVGLDMGTGSLGWAVTDQEYNIIRKHGKALWGSRLFEMAKTAEERRMHRTARRRGDREKWRIQILQEIFSEEISKVDPGFFLRMKESKYWPEDKRDMDGKCPELPYALFVDADYTDKDYHKEFPTIYHLRKMLMETDEMPDIRLVYLALHHMMKHRGHFLLSGDIANIRKFDTTFSQFVEKVRNEELDFHLEFDEESMTKMEELLKDKAVSKSDKKKRLIKELKASTKCEKALLNLIVGGTVKLSEIFSDDELAECEKPSISFADSTYDDYKDTVSSDLAERYIIIEAAKAVYDWSVLADIMGSHDSLSDAKVEIYEKHHEDLNLLKKLVKKYCDRDVYQDIFVNPESKLCNYPAYIGVTKRNGKKVDLTGKRCNKEDFYKFLKKNLKALDGVVSGKDAEILANINADIEQGTFLPKQVNKDNSVLPYQVHEFELKEILENLKSKSELIEKNADKILQTFKFRIPYYVGPLNVIKDVNDPKFSWAVRRTDEKIYPWNFEEVIDTEASAQKFIRRMTNKCTYLYGEDVLPKESLLYSKFMVLNELNNLRINGDKPSVELKQKIYEEVFQKNRKVTLTKLKRYLILEGIADKNVDITGIDGDFKATLTSYHDFKEKLSGAELTDAEKEDIILNVTLFGEDKKLLKRRVTKTYPQLTEKQVKAIGSLSYNGWGRLSREFLENIVAADPETGEVWTIIRALWESNDNLMQLLSSKYEFKDKVDEHNKSDEEVNLSYKTVEELFVSPAVKRQIWQTLSVVKEIQKVMGGPPERIFVEVAREKQESKRTVSRKSALQELYKKCKVEERELTEQLDAQEDSKLRSDRLYLYYTQKGKCMYTGEPIHIEDLWDKNKYDIDHIYPQSKVKDDSIENRVLVKRVDNAEKSDRYPLSTSIQNKMKPFWKSLLEGGFIGKEKYNRLVRTSEFSADELAGFIARQLVETRQSTKIVADVLRQAFDGTEVVYSKAGNVSDFRKDYDLLKVRDLNDLHHAKDAYLNIVVGNTYFVKFTKDAAWFVKKYPGRSYNLKKMFTSGKDVERNGEIAWKGGSDGTIATVRKTMSKNNILVTRKSYKVSGELFDQQLMKKGKGQLPVKSSEERLSSIGKYGGYNKVSGAYYALVESEDKKENLIRTLEEVPIYLSKQVEKDESVYLRYLVENKGLKKPRVIIKCIKKDTLFKINGFPLYLSGRTGQQLIFKCGAQLILEKRYSNLLKKVLNYTGRAQEDKNVKISERDSIEKSNLIELYDELIHKLEASIFAKRPNNQCEFLCESGKHLMTLSCEEICMVISEVLHLFQCKNTISNLKLIGGVPQAGSIKLSKNITKNDEVKIIYQSPTGIFENEIDLKTV